MRTADLNSYSYATNTTKKSNESSAVKKTNNANRFDWFWEQEKMLCRKFASMQKREPNESERNTIFMNLLRYSLGLEPIRAKQNAISKKRSMKDN